MPSLASLNPSDDVDESFFDQLGDATDKQETRSGLLGGLSLSSQEETANQNAGDVKFDQVSDSKVAEPLEKTVSFSDFLSQPAQVPDHGSQGSDHGNQGFDKPPTLGMGSSTLGIGSSTSGAGFANANHVYANQLPNGAQEADNEFWMNGSQTQAQTSWTEYDYRAWEEQFPGWTYNYHLQKWEQKPGYETTYDPANSQQSSYSVTDNGTSLQQQSQFGNNQLGSSMQQQQFGNKQLENSMQQQQFGNKQLENSMQQQHLGTSLQQQLNDASISDGRNGSYWNSQPVSTGAGSSGLQQASGASYWNPSASFTASGTQGGQFTTSNWSNGVNGFSQGSEPAAYWNGSQSAYSNQQYPGWYFDPRANEYKEVPGYQGLQSQNQYQFGQQVNYTVTPPQTLQEALKSTAGRPPHTVVAFGFGGRLVTIKPKDPFSAVEQPSQCQVFHLNQLAGEGSRGFGFGRFTGPLVGGATMKEVLKWIDERVSNCSEEPGCTDTASLKHLWGLLRIACRHYGNLRSGITSAGIGKQDESGPEAALAKLLEPPRKPGAWGYSRCLQSLPTEQELQATAFEVKSLLIAGKQKEALQCAQEGQLWGTALLLARQLGEKHYSETIADMAQRQFHPGFPLRTLSLLFAGQQAGVFVGASVPASAGDSFPTATQDAVEGMLEEWQENLAIMAANRTMGDENVIMYLGDCLWRLRSEVAGAHICYLVANANFDTFHASARLCLIGADHSKYPRTYALPEAIQRTEVYEYARVSGNAQYILLPFQPYKIIYASMLAEAGRINEALRYCQAVLKTLRTAGQGGDVCKEAALALEERLRIHSQAGPTSIVQRFMSNIGLHRIVGSSSPSPAPRDETNARPATSCGRTTPSPLVPSASMEPISGPKSTMPMRSISEPDFHRDKIDGPGGGASVAQNKNVLSSFVQRAIGLLRSPSKEARLGDKSTFRYDPKLQRWVDDAAGALPAEEPTPPPPPMVPRVLPAEDQDVRPSSGFQGTPERPQSASGMPPIPPSSNQYSVRSRNSRSRYVDTFNKNSASTTAPRPTDANLLLPPARQSAMPPAKFFVPVAPDVSMPETSFSQPESHQQGPPMGTQSSLPPENAVPSAGGSATKPPTSEWQEGNGFQQQLPNGSHTGSSSAMFYSNHHPTSPAAVMLPRTAAVTLPPTALSPAAFELSPQIEAAAAGNAPPHSSQEHGKTGDVLVDDMQEVEL